MMMTEIIIFLGLILIAITDTILIYWFYCLLKGKNIDGSYIKED